MSTSTSMSRNSERFTRFLRSMASSGIATTSRASVYSPAPTSVASWSRLLKSSSLSAGARRTLETSRRIVSRRRSASPAAPAPATSSHAIGRSVGMRRKNVALTSRAADSASVGTRAWKNTMKLSTAWAASCRGLRRPDFDQTVAPLGERRRTQTLEGGLRERVPAGLGGSEEARERLAVPPRAGAPVTGRGDGDPRLVHQPLQLGEEGGVEDVAGRVGYGGLRSQFRGAGGRRSTHRGHGAARRRSPVPWRATPPS